MYLQFSDWFGTKREFVWFQINQKMVNAICFGLKLNQKSIPLCVWTTKIFSLGGKCLFFYSIKKACHFWNRAHRSGTATFAVQVRSPLKLFLLDSVFTSAIQWIEWLRRNQSIMIYDRNISKVFLCIIGYISVTYM